MTDDLEADYEEAIEMLFNQAMTIKRLQQENEKLLAALKDLIEDHEYMTDTDAEEDNMARAAARAALKENDND